jgi:group I intron endonuclease
MKIKEEIPEYNKELYQEKIIGKVIYKLTSPSGKSYIGQTRNFRMRCNEHKSSSRCTRLSNAIKKYGFDLFTHQILESGLSDEQANYLEEKYIKEHSTRHPNGYNLASGGMSSRHSDESKKLISLAQKGRVKSELEKLKMSESRKGKVLTDEHKENIRIANIGKKMSPDAIAKTAAAKIGKKLSAEHKEKLRAFNTGRKASDETKAKMSAAGKGKRIPEESVKKSADSRRGVKRTEETKERMRAAYAKRREYRNELV